MERSIRLSEKLKAIAGFIEMGASVADIGTDHGYLPVYLAQNELASRIIASDISSGSLDSAVRSASKYGVSDKIAFTVAPGLSGVKASDVDTVVIAGVGGETIVSILRDAPWTKRQGFRLVLQPQSKLDILCTFLRNDGYAISDATLVLDDGRYYIVILVEGTVQEGASSAVCDCGVDVGAICQMSNVRDESQCFVRRSDDVENPYPCFIDKRCSREPSSCFCFFNSPSPCFAEIELLSLLAGKPDPLFDAFIDQLIAKTRRAVAGIKRSGTANYPGLDKRLEDLINLRASTEEIHGDS